MAVDALGRPRAWFAAYRLQLIMLAVSLLFVGACGEIAVRLLGATDEDGNFAIFGRRLRPYHLPVNRVAAAVQRYDDSTNTMFVYDPNLGWKPRPNARNAESVHDAAGLRVAEPREPVERAPRAGVLRIALFGDSFVYGSEVLYPDSWAFGLAQRLEADGRRVEVLNFGVPGYGTDQAYLRWLEEGSGYAPHIVIFGLQLENMHRNANLVRPLYIPTVDLPFSKPRFIFEPRGTGRVINRPAVPPSRLPELLNNFERWEWHAEEAFYSPAQYERKWWLRSRLLAATIPPLLERIGSLPREQELTPVKQELTLRILSDFAQSVSERGARFVIVHLPTRSDLQTLSSSGEPPLPAFLERIRTRFELTDPADSLVRLAQDATAAALFRPGGHYTAIGNAAVADRVAEQLRAVR